MAMCIICRHKANKYLCCYIMTEYKFSGEPNTGIPHGDYVVKLGIHAYTSKPSCSLKICKDVVHLVS